MKKFKRYSLKILYPLARIYWSFTHPTTLGVRVLIFNSNGEVLLLKHSYKKYLYPPGGAVNKFEYLKDAAIREVWEETSIQLKTVDIIGVYRRFKENKNDTLVLFVSKMKTNQDIKIDNIEIDDASWHDPKDLPKDTSPIMVKFITEYLKDPKVVNFN